MSLLHGSHQAFLNPEGQGEMSPLWAGGCVVPAGPRPSWEVWEGAGTQRAFPAQACPGPGVQTGSWAVDADDLSKAPFKKWSWIQTPGLWVMNLHTEEAHAW